MNECRENLNGDELSHIKWSNIIFLPFNPVFQFLTLCSVIVKTTLGPLRAIYPNVYYWDIMDLHIFLSFLRTFYWYCADLLYGIDTLLHIIHRQVTDQAMRREYAPKYAFLLLLDLFSLIPFIALLVNDHEADARLWPNLLAYNEFLIIYRIWEYFSLRSTHSYLRLGLGFTMMMAITTNCITSFWVLLTYEGLCANCNKTILDYDWRSYVQYKLIETDIELSTYVYALSFVYTHAVRVELDHTLPSTILEFVMICLFMLIGDILLNIIVIPKIFAESTLRLRQICAKYPHVQKIIEETKRRNPSQKAYHHVEMYYTTMWTMRNGVVCMPDIINSIPSYLRLEIKEDLLWPLFYHSPTLRKTSNAFKRWLSEFVGMSYKLPGERFYSSRQYLSNLYYVKSGVVQLISIDDGTTPILSITSGTTFGDVNFLIPHRIRKAVMRCLTYSEIYFLTRADIIRALHRFPEDRKLIRTSFKQRVDHAKVLFNSKNQIRGQDRNEDEGIAWIRRRWWEIFDAINSRKKDTSKKDSQVFGTRCELPREETSYHCAKYLSQLVLCTDAQLQTKSMFVKDSFPWIISPYSQLCAIWKGVIIFTVAIALLTYPPHIIKCDVPQWFQFILFWIDIVYLTDLLVAISTAMTIEENESLTYISVIFERCKSLNFVLDILSAIWFESIVVIINLPHLYYSVQFNRMIKIYVLFSSNYIKWDINKNPVIEVCRKIVIAHFAFLIIISHIVYEISEYYPHISMKYFFGSNLCSKQDSKYCEPCHSFLGVAMPWTNEQIFPEVLPLKEIDILIAIAITYLAYILYAFCKGRYLSYFYLKYQNSSNYGHYVLNVKKYCQNYGIHIDLLRRLERYLICHYKYYKGIDVMQPNSLKREPFEIFWKVQGEVAEKIIAASKVFQYADNAFVRELACAAKYIIYPRNSTLYLCGCQCKIISWVVQGHVKSERHQQYGELVTKMYGPGEMLSTLAVFSGKVALKTYTACTDCEHQTKLRERLSSVRKSSPLLSRSSSMYLVESSSQNPQSSFKRHIWGDPESWLMQTWLMFRAFIVFVSIVNSSIQGGIGVQTWWSFKIVGIFCDAISWIDIALKLFIYYYDDRGLLITAKSMCLKNYLSKGFLLDVIGALPWFELIRVMLTTSIKYEHMLLINTACKFAHIYIFFAYFKYISDLPTVNVLYIIIVKWQFVNLLILMYASQYIFSNCLDYVITDDNNLQEIVLRNDCWIPKIYTLPQKLDSKSLHFIFVQSLNLAGCGMLGMSHGGFSVRHENYGLFFVLFFLGPLFWLITCYTLTLLVLSNQRDRVFQHGVNDLKNFMLEERVDKKTVKKVLSHFHYYWTRTKGVSMEQITNECIGVVFKEDLSYFFYKRTYMVLDTLLMGGESMQRQLSSVSTVKFFLPGHEIMREMDLMTELFIVHRGRVFLNKDGRKVITLTKGDIFGQLIGTRIRPVRISAVADGNVDVLQISVQSFQKIICDEVRQNIAKNAHAKNDFMATRTLFVENPYETVEYLLRGKKAVHLPWMYEPLEVKRGSWYSWWLHLIWFCCPFVTSIIVFLLPWAALHSMHINILYKILIFLDVLHVANFIMEFYSTNLTVEDNKCVQRIVGLGLLKHWGFYVDALSLIIPLLTLINYDPRFQLAKLLRLKWFIDFQYHFCQGFKSEITPRILKGAIVCLLVHFCTCGWIYVACSEEIFPISVPDFKGLNATVDYTEWTHPNDRQGGCARVTNPIIKKGNELLPAFVVPVFWAYDYVIALTYVLLIHTRTSLDTVMALTTNQLYYKLIITFVMYLLDMWLLSEAISSVYTRFREQYNYDYLVNNLITFLKDSGLNPKLSDNLREYTEQLWRKHKGNWLPELTYQGPICLREDLFVALYIHHLDSSSTFRQLPFYFKRQLAARFERTVIFPGKCIVHEGDVSSVTYFIHEGEVEKWYNDEKGEGRMMSLLYTNGYFGSVPGLFVTSAFQFSYYTRTVVDLVYLRLEKWEDLLEGYPDIKKSLYKSTQALKNESLKVYRS